MSILPKTIKKIRFSSGETINRSTFLEDLTVKSNKDVKIIVEQDSTSTEFAFKDVAGLGELTIPADGKINFGVGPEISNTSDALNINAADINIEATDEIVVSAGAKSWNFANTGLLQLPIDGDIVDENGDSVLNTGTAAGAPRLTIHGYLDGVTVPGTAKNFITFTTGKEPISALYLTKFISVDNRGWFAIQVGSTWTASQTAITADHVAYGHFGPNATLVNTLGANLLATTGYTLLPETSYTMWIQQINAITEYAFSTSPLDQGGNEYTVYSNVTSTPNVIPFYTSIGSGPVALSEEARLSNTILEGTTTHNQLVEAIKTKTNAGLTVVHDFKTSSTWYHSSISQDFTPNFTNIPTNNDRVIPLKLIVANGATPYKPLSPIKIAGTDVAVTWEGGVYPTGTANLTTVWTYNLVRNAGTWKVFGKAELYTASTDVGSRAYTHSPTFTGTPLAPTATAATATTQIATTAFVGTEITNAKASPTFTGVPLAPTAVAGTNTTQIATTEFVKTAVDNVIADAPGALNTLDELAAALGDDQNYAATITTALGNKAPTASPTFSGIVTASDGTEASAYNTAAVVLSGGLGVTKNIRSNGLIYDSKGELRNLPQNSKTAAYTLVLADAGKHISITTGGVIVPAGVFAIGDSITIFNNSSSTQTITTTAVTCYVAGTSLTGNRSLAQRGLCTLLCVASNIFVITGAGLT